MRYYFLVSAFLITAYLKGQDTEIKGTVYDAITEKPLSYASIYFNSTTNGTITDESGKFTIPYNPNFNELIVSFLGYEPISLVIDTTMIHRPYGFYLKPVEQVIETVKIKGKRDKSWYNNLAQFKAQFIGTSELAEKTEILNEGAIYFSYDKNTRILKAFSREPLKIKNEALGYNITYDLVEFTLDKREGKCLFLGYPRYSDIREKPKKKWIKARKKAYLGSFLHFSQTLVRGTTEEEGFTVRKLTRKKRKDNAMGMEVQSEKLTIDTRPNRSRKVDYLEKEPQDPRQFLAFADNTYFLEIPSLWQITYSKEKMDKFYRPPGYYRNSSWSKMPQTSILHTNVPKVAFNSGGIIINPLDVLVEGYWSHEKLADMVPLDYKLPEKD